MQGSAQHHYACGEGFNCAVGTFGIFKKGEEGWDKDAREGRKEGREGGREGRREGGRGGGEQMF